MAFAQSARRPIEGAVATQGVSDRVTFLRKTYAHLGVALIAFAAITAGMMRFMPETSLRFSAWALNGYHWLLVLGLFMVVGYVAERLAMSQTSKALQYVGLGVAVLAEGILLQPMLWVAMYKLGAHDGMKIITEAGVITMLIFVGLTLTVFITKKDFSFMRGVLMICSFGALGVIFASLAFGFQLGAVFSGLMILLMSGYVLFQTSLIMSYFPPTGYVAASLMLFSTIATLFWYVLRLMMELNRR
jgi:FtsH-binding integral membrane protein